MSNNPLPRRSTSDSPPGLIDPITLFVCLAFTGVGYAVCNLPTLYDDSVAAGAACDPIVDAAEQPLARVASEGNLIENASVVAQSELCVRDPVRAARGCSDMIYYADCYRDFLQSNHSEAYRCVRLAREAFANDPVGAYLYEPSWTTRILRWFLDIFHWQPRPVTPLRDYDRFMLARVADFENRVNYIAREIDAPVAGLDAEFFLLVHERELPAPYMTAMLPAPLVTDFYGL